MRVPIFEASAVLCDGVEALVGGILQGVLLPVKVSEIGELLEVVVDVPDVAAREVDVEISLEGLPDGVSIRVGAIIAIILDDGHDLHLGGARGALWFYQVFSRKIYIIGRYI